MTRIMRLLAFLGPLGLFIASPAVAPAQSAGLVCTITVMDGTGRHPTWFFDPAGTCAPGNTLVPVGVNIDNNGNPGPPAVGNTPVSAQVTCANTATALLAADITKAVRTISNQSGATIFLGPAGVTITTGLPVPTTGGYDASHEQGALFCVSAAGGAVVGTMQY